MNDAQHAVAELARLFCGEWDNGEACQRCHQQVVDLLVRRDSANLGGQPARDPSIPAPPMGSGLASGETKS